MNKRFPLQTKHRPAVQRKINAEAERFAKERMQKAAEANPATAPKEPEYCGMLRKAV